MQEIITRLHHEGAIDENGCVAGVGRHANEMGGGVNGTKRESAGLEDEGFEIMDGANEGGKGGGRDVFVEAGCAISPLKTERLRCEAQKGGGGA